MAGKGFAGRRARAALLWCAGCFLLTQLGSSVLLDYCFPWVRFPDAARVLAVPLAARQSPDIIFLGSSRFGAGVCAAEVARVLRRQGTRARVFNASIAAGDAITADFMLEQLLHDGARPALAVVEVSPETINRRNDWMPMHLHRQLRWHDVPAYLTDLGRSSNLLRWLRERLVPLHVHRQEVCRQATAAVRCWLDPSGPELVRGVPVPANTGVTLDQGLEDSRPVPWEHVIGLPPREDAARLRASSQAQVRGILRMLRDYRPGGQAGAALERLLRRCRRQGIAVILVGVPVTSAHRALYTPAIEAAFQSYIGALRGAHECAFVDWRGRVPDHLFLDIHHLSDAGGVWFSRVLAHEVLAPAWAALGGSQRPDPQAR